MRPASTEPALPSLISLSLPLLILDRDGGCLPDAILTSSICTDRHPNFLIAPPVPYTPFASGISFPVIDRFDSRPDALVIFTWPHRVQRNAPPSSSCCGRDVLQCARRHGATAGVAVRGDFLSEEYA